MMKLLRNSEVRKSLLLYLIISAVAIISAFLQDERVGIFTLILCVVFIAAHLLTTYARYKHISELAFDVNRILHGDNEICLKKYSEGELAILHSEIYKMTIRLREQQQKLVDDKVYLADSIADISHQIRTPLTSINLLVQFLSEPNISEERRCKLSHELYVLLSRIDWLITALLKISKIDAGTVKFNRENISLDELLNKTCASLLVPIELRGQEMSIKAEGSFCGDVLWTCEALSNIIKNCMEHTPEGGKIEVVAEENPLYTQIVISDNGSGISQDDLPHIFERFYKGKDSDENSFGVGLALARMIIVEQNGVIKAENRNPKGAKFTVRFYKGTV